MGRTIRTLVVAVCAALCLVGNAVAVHAQGAKPASATELDRLPRRARVLLANCKNGPFDRKVFIDVLRLELASHDIDMPLPSAGTQWTDDDVRITIDTKSCRKDGRSADVELRHPRTGREASRSVVFSFAEPKGRARVLAIAVVEFVLLHWQRLGDAPTDPQAEGLRDLRERLSAQEKELARLATLRTGAATTRPLPKRMFALGPAAEWFLEYSSATLGPYVVMSVGVHDNVRLEPTIEAGLGRSRAFAGNVQLRTVSAGLSALFGGGGRVWIGAGPHLSAGWVRVRGDVRDNITLAVETSTEDRVTGAAGFHVGLRALLKGRWWVLVDGRFAYGFRRIGGEADEGVRGGVGGSTVRLGASFGVGF